MKLGDHVRALSNGEFRHGIDCGDRTVLFLSRDASGHPEVRRALLAEFAAGAEHVETVVHREQVFPPRAVVARAFSRLRDPTAAASFGSSEAFAAWCLTGRRPEPGYAPATVPAPARPAHRAAAGKAKATRRTGRTLAQKRKARGGASRRTTRKAAPRPAPRRKKAPARRPARRRRRRR